MKNILKKTARFLAFVLLLVVVIAIIPYLLCPVYNFPPERKFSGTAIYNPYHGIDSMSWHKANFHMHSRVWGGITNGRINTGENIWNLYRKLGYHYNAVSDYMSINNYGKDSASYIPCYEHGVNLRKTHQVLIGSKHVLWYDFVFYQSVHHKQQILNKLRNDNDVVAIAHPQLRDGYSVEEMTLLTNYDLIEALNNNRFSIEYWDSALSSGHLAYIISDDDAHDINDPREIERCCTYVYSSENMSSEVIRALKSGRAYGAEIFMANGEDMKTKIKKSLEIPKLEYVDVKNDSLIVRVSMKAKNIRFIGQNGAIKLDSGQTRQAAYKLRPDDTYIRTEIVFPNESGQAGTRFLLNPVFRYSGDINEYRSLAKENIFKTIIFRFIILSVILIIVVIVFRKRC